MATTDGGGAGAVRVRGVPSGGVSGAGALVGGAEADDVGSVIDFPLWGVVWDALCGSTPVGPAGNAANLLDAGGVSSSSAQRDVLTAGAQAGRYRSASHQACDCRRCHGLLQQCKR